MSMSNGPAWRVLSAFFRRRGMAALLTVLVTAAAGFDIVVPFITQHLIDSLITFFRQPGGNPWEILFPAALGILVATALTRGIRSIYNYYLFKAATATEDELRYRAFENYLRLHTLYHQSSNSGQIIGRIERGAAAVFAIVYEIVGQSLAPPLIIFAGVLVALSLKSFWIALAVFLPLPFYLLVVRRMTARIYECEREISEGFEAVAKESYDVASNVSTVKKFSREQWEIRHQRKLMDQARFTQYRGERQWAYIENTQNLIATFGRVSVIVLGGFLVLIRKATIGEFVLFVTLQNMAYQPMSQLSVIFPRLRRAISRVERLLSVLDEPIGIPDRPDAVDLPPLRHSIEFRNVWFRYGDDKRWTLRDVNVKIPAGSTVALVGRSGSGKTTFMNLLMRSYEPQKGQILIDGVDIRDVKQESLRSMISVVPQEVDLFSRPIFDNIAYSKPDATTAEVEEAAKMALAHDFILRAEDGYQTVVGERGVKLSGGERQRIGIARAILRNPAILILDEATSHLDNESEQLIQQATEMVVKNRTSFLIAHRLSTILHADLIVVFNDSQIEAIGTHENLPRLSPTYKKLYALHVGAAAGERKRRANGGDRRLRLAT